MKHRKKTIILLLTMALTLFSSVVFSPPAVSEANSAPRETKGYDSSGVIVKTENSPIVVDTEDLTFHIYSADRFIPVQEYGRRGIVTAEYTFHNPTNLTVETRCLFPFGFVPYDESQTEAGFTRRVLKNCPTAISRFSFARRKIPKGTSRRSER